MFFELSKIFNFALSPVTWLFFLLLGAFIWKNRQGRKRVCLYSALVVFLVFTNELLVKYVEGRAVGEYGSAVLTEGKNYQVAIVMGGFGHMNRQTGQMKYEKDRADRLWEAVRLYKTGRVERILITGDGTSCYQTDGSHTAELFLTYMGQFGIPEEAFLLEKNARNSRENAVYTIEMLRKWNIPDNACLLITSATHMKRSLGCFAKAGIQLDYLPVNIYDPPAALNHRSFYPSWTAAVKWQEILNEWVGDLIYKGKGYI